MSPWTMVVLALLGGQGGGRPPAPPKGLEAARMAFVGGDVKGATELARACGRKEAACRALLRPLAEYAPLAKAVDRLTPTQARRMLELDRLISPGAPGAISVKVLERFVVAPLALARHHAQEGNTASAQVIARQVLAVDPGNDEARELAGAPQR